MPGGGRQQVQRPEGWHAQHRLWDREGSSAAPTRSSKPLHVGLVRAAKADSPSSALLHTHSASHSAKPRSKFTERIMGRQSPRCSIFSPPKATCTALDLPTPAPVSSGNRVDPRKEGNASTASLSRDCTGTVSQECCEVYIPGSKPLSLIWLVFTEHLCAPGSELGTGGIHKRVVQPLSHSFIFSG